MTDLYADPQGEQGTAAYTWQAPHLLAVCEEARQRRARERRRRILEEGLEFWQAVNEVDHRHTYDLIVADAIETLRQLEGEDADHPG